MPMQCEFYALEGLSQLMITINRIKRLYNADLNVSGILITMYNSSISEAAASDFDYNKIFEGADWFHWTGITPALSKNCAEIIEKACVAAKAVGATVSCDLNYRKKLWSPSEAQAVMRPLMKYVDVCIGNEEDAEMCLGFKPDANVVNAQTAQSGYYDIFKAMKSVFGFCIQLLCNHT